MKIDIEDKLAYVIAVVSEFAQLVAGRCSSILPVRTRYKY